MRRIILAALLTLAGTPGAGAAQAPALRLLVVDSATGQPVPQARVRMGGVRGAVLTDDSGRVSLAWRGEADLRLVEVTRLGYRRHRSQHGHSAELRIALAASGVRLAGVTVQAPERNQKLEDRGFYERRDGHRGGTFLTEAEIRRLSASRTIDVFGHIPGFRVERTRDGRSVLASTRGGARRCSPIVFIDGALVSTRPTDAEYAINLVPLVNVAAIEAYAGSSSIPVAYRQHLSACGAVIIWTKLPDQPD